MADISAEIAAFQNAVYGEDVRDAMVSLANKINNESSAAAAATADGFVTTAKLADGAVTLAKLGNDVEITPPDGSITNAKLADGSVTDAKLAQSGGVLARVADLTSDVQSVALGDIPAKQVLVTKKVNSNTSFDVTTFNAEAGRRYRIDVTNIDALVGAYIEIRFYNGGTNIYFTPTIRGNISANTKRTLYFNCTNTETGTLQILRRELTENATFAVGVICDDYRRDIDTLGTEISQISADVDMNFSRNLIGPELNVIYPVPPLKTGDVITISAFNPANVNSYAQVKFIDSDNNEIKVYQFDYTHASAGRRVTLDIGESIVHYITVNRNCGSPIMVERGIKTDFIPHYPTNYEKYLNSVSSFGEFELFLPEQALIIRRNLATAMMQKRLCFGHVSDNHSTVYPHICNIIDLSDAKFIVNTGDIVQDKYSDNYTGSSDMINAMTKPHYITLGNHDVYQAPSINDVFTKYFSPIISHNGQSNLDKTYYSVDFTDESVKCIFLNPYDALNNYSSSMNTVIAGKMSETQINWFFTQLDEALTNSMHVCIFLHLSPEIVGEREKKFYDVNTNDSKMVTYSFIADVVDAFIDGTSVTFNHGGNSYTHTFTSAGIFVGYFCGHMHCDCIGKLKTHDRQNAFSVTRPWQSASDISIHDGVYRHGSNRWGMAVFNYVTVDPNNRHVSIMRVIQQDTKYGFKRDFVTVEY